MKLLFCHDGPMPIDKDGNAYPQNFTEEIISRYHVIADEVTMLMRTNIIDPKKTKNPRLNMAGLNIVRSPNLASLKGILRNQVEAKRILKRELTKCDFLIARLPSFIGNMAIDMALKMDIPYLIELVACPWDAFWNYSLKGRFIAPLMYYATKTRVRNADYVIYVTNEFLQKRYPTNGKTTNCSNVSLKKLDYKVLEKRINKIKSMNDESTIIIGTTAAVDVRYKGQQYIIKALGELKKAGRNNYEYQLVGGGDQAYLQSIADKYNVSDQLKFLGSMPHNEVFDWLDTIDLYAQPSRQEGLPRALIEAMSRGVPAFGADTAGIPELLEKSYIFSNTRKNINEICNILKMFELNTMSSQAKRNYKESKKYNKKLIEERRKRFLMKAFM